MTQPSGAQELTQLSYGTSWDSPRGKCSSGRVTQPGAWQNEDVSLHGRTAPREHRPDAGAVMLSKTGPGPWCLTAAILPDS